MYETAGYPPAFLLPKIGQILVVRIVDTIRAKLYTDRNLTNRRKAHERRYKMKSKRITRQWLQKWIEDNRPHLGIHETVHGNKGIYRLDSGPAHSFETRGKTWKEVYESLQPR